MTEQLSLEEITALLLDEHQKAYSNSIPPKALHKVLYFAEQEFEREHLDVELPIFWYIYGAVVKTSNSGVRVTSTEHGQRVACDTDISDITASDVTIRKGRRALSRSLDQYYDLGLDSLTDKMYREAPYDIQRTYRRLDKQLEVATDDEQTTLFGRKNEEPTRETLCEFVGHFPLTEFPEYEDDLYIWYRLMSAEIDSDDYNPSRAQRLAKMFWRLFCLELACRNDHGLSREEIAEEVNADSISDAKSQLRSKFLALEREKARANASDSEEALKAAEAFVVPFLDVSIPV